MCARQESNLHRLLRREASYPLNDERDFWCALGRNRTCDLLDRNQTLYPLSYKRKFFYLLQPVNQLEVAVPQPDAPRPNVPFGTGGYPLSYKRNLSPIH